MNYLEQYGSAPESERAALVGQWIRTEWRPFFKELRERRPVFATPGITLVTRFADVIEVLSREQVFSVRLYVPRMDPVVGPFMLARDGTAINWREKGIMQAVLRPEDAQRVGELVGGFADEALEAAAPGGRIDVVPCLGRHVAQRLCDAYFGLPGPDPASVLRWSRATQCDMFKNLADDPAVHEASLTAGREMTAYLAELIPRRQAELADASTCEGEVPPQDIVSRLLRTRLPGELGFDDRRILANVAGLLIGGIETTSQAVAQVLEQILLRPDVREAAVAAAMDDDPGRLAAYVWEALRFNPINPLVFRYCETGYRLAAGTPRESVIPAGTIVFACTASAMFDEVVLAEPENFRLHRPDFLRLHFGYGHHACLGRLVGSAVIPRVVRQVLRRPGVRLLPPPEGSIDFRGGPFPERFVIALDAPDVTTPAG
ncbi:MAG TPA: cytochrome P450 [Kineosporiaceae bacterium]